MNSADRPLPKASLLQSLTDSSMRKLLQSALDLAHEAVKLDTAYDGRGALVMYTESVWLLRELLEQIRMGIRSPRDNKASATTEERKNEEKRIQDIEIGKGVEDAQDRSQALAEVKPPAWALDTSNSTISSDASKCSDTNLWVRIYPDITGEYTARMTIISKTAGNFGDLPFTAGWVLRKAVKAVTVPDADSHSTSGYGPPPIPGQPIGGAYQPQYASPPYHSPQGPSQSFYSPPPGPPSTSYYPPPPTVHHSGYPAPPVLHSQQLPPPPNASTYPGAPQGSYVPPLRYLGTEVVNVFVSGDHITPGYNPAEDVEKIRNATKGFGTNDDALISTLAPLSAMKIQAVANRFLAAYGLQLVDVLDKESRFNFNWCLRALAMGPLGWDVWLLREAMQGIGTKEKILTEILLARPMSDIHILINAYQYFTGRHLIQDVQNDLSMKTKRSYSDRPADTAPVDYAYVARDVDALYNAGEKRFGTDELVFCEIFINRNPAHLKAVFEAYPKKYKKYKTFAKVVRAEFRGHMQDALLHIYKGTDPKHDQPTIYRDAKLIHKAMKGFGTRDHELIWRVVRAHWDHIRFESIKAAYFKKQKTTLEYHIAKDTSGSYCKLLLELTKANASKR
ncbi:hypothetical protein C0995_011246 [Termitomyces sp. Mi166|nr:hypothetical protein C0995_011246 [Termitomyces sp. Mi166\